MHEKWFKNRASEAVGCFVMSFHIRNALKIRLERMFEHVFQRGFSEGHKAAMKSLEIKKDF